MFSAPSSPSRDAQPWWLLLLLAAYAVLELSFNHHLMEVGSAAVTDLAALKDLEFWARLISGLGLSLWLTRALLRRGMMPVLALLLGVGVGLTLMWHLQRWLVDRIVAQASMQDKQMSLYAQQLAPALLGGQLLVRGKPLVHWDRLPADARPAWRALLPAITLGLVPSDIQAGELQAAMKAQPWPDQWLTDAYRRAVMVPIALGVSLMFGLANLCLLLSLLIRRCWPGSMAQAWRHNLVFFLLWASVLCWSLSAHASDASASAYPEIARPTLRANQPLLAPFVEWTLRAQPAWQSSTGWMHDHLLGGYAFGRLPGLE
ncbi:MAG: hypothetical protein WCK08_20605 [Betaproteobacteria bacterium]